MNKFNQLNALTIASIAGLSMHHGLQFSLDVDGGADGNVAPVAPTPVDPGAAPVAPVAPEVKSEDITLRGVAVKLIKDVVKKGKNKGNPDYRFDLPMDETGIEKFAEIVGPENFLRAVFKGIHAAVRETSNEAFDVKDGKLIFNLPRFETLLVDYYNPDRSRKSGPSKAELQETVNMLVADSLMPLIKKQGTSDWTQDDAIELARITTEIGELQAKILAKTRPAKAAK